MDITTLAAWGEFLGGIAVVVSLVYLASQIRQNSRLLQVSTTVALAQGDLEFWKLTIQDPDVMRIFSKGALNLESLSETERLRFDGVIQMFLREFQQSYFVAQDGALKPGLWEGEIKVMAWMFDQAGPRQWWDENRFGFGDEFGDYVDGLIREGEAAG